MNGAVAFWLMVAVFWIVVGAIRITELTVQR